MKSFFRYFVFCTSFAICFNINSAAALANLWIVEGWPGETPEPVVHIKKPINLKAYQNVTDKKPTLDCKVDKTGVYHPWAKKIKSEYKQLVSSTKYKAFASMSLEPLDSSKAKTLAIKVGDEIDQLTDHGIEFCKVRFKGEVMETLCPSILKKNFKRISGKKTKPIQFFSVDCSNGKKSWIRVNDQLFGNPSVSKGRFKGYGEIVE